MEDKEIQATQSISTRQKTVEARLEWSLDKEIVELHIKSKITQYSPKYIVQIGKERTLWNKEEYMGLFLEFGKLQNPENRDVTFTLSMKDECGNLIGSKTTSVKASKVPNGFGFATFSNISELHYVNDKITFVCNLAVPAQVNQRIQGDLLEKVKCDSQESEKVFLEHMKTMYSLPEFSDLTIFCGDQKFLCHKNVLASRSDVFKDLLGSGSIESELEITDSSPHIFKAVIDHIYTGKITKDTTNATELFRLAMKYNLQILAKSCEIILLGQLSDTNATDTLVTLDTHKSTSDTKNEVMKYITVNATNIMDTEKFKEFAKEHSDLMLEVYRFSILNQNKEVLETVRKDGTK